MRYAEATGEYWNKCVAGKKLKRKSKNNDNKWIAAGVWKSGYRALRTCRTVSVITSTRTKKSVCVADERHRGKVVLLLMRNRHARGLLNHHHGQNVIRAYNGPGEMNGTRWSHPTVKQLSVIFSINIQNNINNII